MEEVIRMKVGNGQLAMSGRSELRKTCWERGWGRSDEVGAGGPHQGDWEGEPEGTAMTQSRDEERVDFCRVHSRRSSLPNQCPWRQKWRKNKVISVGKWMKNRLKMGMWGVGNISLWKFAVMGWRCFGEQQRVSRLRENSQQGGLGWRRNTRCGEGLPQWRQSFPAQGQWGPSSE